MKAAFKLIKLSLLVIVAALVVGKNVAVAAEQPIPITIGWLPGTYYAFYVARDQKLFEKAGLAPTFVKFTAGPPMFSAFQSRSIDVSWGGAVPAIIGAAQGVPLKIIALESVTDNALVVKNNGPVKKLSDLAGKKIGTVKGSGAYFAMVKLMQMSGLDQKYDFVDMQMPSLLPAFGQGNVDAIWVWEPWASRAVADDGRRLGDELNIFGAYPGAPIMARSDWVSSNPEAVRRFLAAMKLAQETYAKDPSNAIAAMAREVGISQDMARDIFDRDPKPTFAHQVTPNDPYSIVGANAPQVKYFQSVGDFFHASGFITTAPDMSKVFDADPLVQTMK
jgi:aliphatic sulfonates family ABC transporter substrate-binding protein